MDITSTNSTLSAAASAFEDVLTSEETPSAPKAAKPTKQAKAPEPEDEAPAAESDDEEVEAQSDEEDEEPQAQADESESDEEGDDEGGEEADTDEEQEPVYQVRVAGQEVEVPLSELVKGYSRTADYTRKTQELAAARTEFNGEVQQTRVLREQYAQRLQQVQQLLQQADPQVNWDKLRAEDPIEFAAQWADHQRRQEALQQVQAEQAQIQQRRQHETQAQQAKHLEEARTQLGKMIPEWKDQKVAKTEMGAMKEFGRSLGYSDDELGSVMDPRAVVLLRMAHKYQDLVQRRATLKPVKVNKPPVLKPGAAAPRKETRQVSELTRMKQSHAKAGTVKSAAALFEKFL
jgi:hypothetical protein